MERISPLIDFVFKKLFGAEESKDILIDVINSIVSESDKVSEIQLINPYNDKNFNDDKLSILDVKAKCVHSGKWYNLEMQVISQTYFDARALYYWSRLYQEQLPEGHGYSKLTKTMTINFLNFNYLDEKKYHNIFRLFNVETKNEYPSDYLEIHFVELKKFPNEFNSLLDKWVGFLNNATIYDKNTLPQELNIPTIIKASNILEHLSFNKEERDIYDARLKAMRDELGAIETAERRGRDEGKSEGIKEGKEEATINIVKQLLSSGVEISTIQKASGLTELQIQQIQNK